MQPGEAHRAHHRAGQRLHAAQQHHHQAVDALAHVQALRRDAALGEGEQCPGHASHGARQHEGRPLHALDIDADRVGAQRRVASGAHRVAKGREQDAPQQPGAGHGQHQGQAIVGALVRQPGRGPHARDAVAAARDAVPLVDDGPGNLREGQREHGQVHTRQAHREPAEQHGKGGGHQRAEGQGQLHRQAGLAHQQRRAVGRQAEVGGVAEGVHAARAHDEVQADGKQGGHQQVNRQHGDVRRRASRQGQGHQHQQQCRSGPLRGLAGQAQRRFRRRGVAAGRGCAPHQPPGPQDQHRGHHQELHHQGELGKRELDAEDFDQPDPDADGLDLGDEQGGHEGARDRAHAAHDHHHEGGADGVQVHLQIGGLARQLQRAAQAGEQGAQREDRGEEPGLVDAQRGHHVAVLRGGAHQRAPARACQQQPQRPQHSRADHDEKQVVGGEAPAQDLHGAGQPRRARAQQLLRPPQAQHQVLEDQGQRKGGQQLKQLGRVIDAPQQQHLHQRPDQPHRHRRQQQRRPEPDDPAQPLHQGVGDVDAHHVERTMRKVDDARDAEDQRQAGGHHEQGRRAGQAVEQLDEKAGEAHGQKGSGGLRACESFGSRLWLIE